ncbi:SDR family NAD(P)-dependent oxidoreductase [Streptomyces sp. MA15]|uniref:SDR family oxidoreductase n=1 Tax=Streptomyces sp. MA15 TaxID=3055061 RepID=UPI0025B0E428|nr:SDR family NAD(P)-dependent oxidoreductase [Streptomyces sp. MA15]MDN3270344.1 SDR family oxidoreductase [Streptomyces sp. MA15]
MRRLRQAVARGGPGKPADLINTSSIAATRILEKFSVYSGTKAYISHLTRLLRVELGPKTVRVATIEPGMADTELPGHVTDPDATELMADLIHDIDVLQSEDIAFIATVPRHVNPTEITTLPTAQTIWHTTTPDGGGTAPQGRPLLAHTHSHTGAAISRDHRCRRRLPASMIERGTAMRPRPDGPRPSIGPPHQPLAGSTECASDT